MISILIVDDNSTKIKAIVDCLNTIPDILNSSIVTASDGNTGRKHLQERQFDLLILDLSLPERFGEDPEIDGGVKFLNEINLDSEIILPFHIIGLTAYEELKVKYLEEFNNNLWHLVFFEYEFNTWSLLLKTHILYLIKSKAELRNPSNVKYEFDLAIITALGTVELSQILKLPAKWEPFSIKNDHTIYHKGIFGNENKKISVVVANSDQMGLTAATLTSQKLIMNFRPKTIAICGIAAGIKGKGNYGDIVVADLSWDYGSGKIITDSSGEVGFKQDPRPLQIDPVFKSILMNEERLQSFNHDIELKWANSNGKTIPFRLKMVLGPMASGSYVIENIEKVHQVVDQQRKLVAIDMETYGVYFAAYNSTEPKPKAISIKSICDFGDEYKSDEYQNYAAFTSSNYLFLFVLKYL